MILLIGDDLGEAADDVQRRTHLVADILDERRLHLVGVDNALVGHLEFAKMAPARLHDIYQCHDEQQQEYGDDGQTVEPDAGGPTLRIVDAQLVLDALHGAGEDDAVDGVALGGTQFQGIVGFLPPAGGGIDVGHGLVGVIGILTGDAEGLVEMLLKHLIVDVEFTAMNGGQPLCDALLVVLIAFKEACSVAKVIVCQRTACLNVEDTLRRTALGNGQCTVDESKGLCRTLVHIDIDEVHIDRRDALGVALLLHAVYHFPEAGLGGLLVTAVFVNMPHHIDGHIHLLVEFPLGEFPREFRGPLVGFEDILPVEEEDDFVAALRVIGMEVVLFEKVVLQGAHSLKETGAVACIEGMVHGVTQLQVAGGLLIGRLVGSTDDVGMACQHTQQENE